MATAKWEAQVAKKLAELKIQLEEDQIALASSAKHNEEFMKLFEEKAALEEAVERMEMEMDRVVNERDLLNEEKQALQEENSVLKGQLAEKQDPRETLKSSLQQLASLDTLDDESVAMISSVLAPLLHSSRLERLGSEVNISPVTATEHNPASLPLMVIKEKADWVPNGKQCLICSTKFTLRCRRHHCRFCGLLVCAACSVARLPSAPVSEAPSGGRQKVFRACSRCLAKASFFGDGAVLFDDDDDVELEVDMSVD